MHTPSFVLTTYENGESSATLSLFTEKFGRIRAKAQGVRKNDSKLRYSLQRGSFSSVSLVRGKEIWRVVNAHEHSALPFVIESPEKRKLYARLLSLVARFCGEEQKEERIFSEVENAVAFLNKEDFSKEDLFRFELVSVLRILHLLGYINKEGGAQKEELEILISQRQWTRHLLDKASGIEKELLLILNTAFRESGL